tara:strand:+ start:5 stop:793 length:789 start_codon:yes stop_codon:yes gene_type:complete
MGFHVNNNQERLRIRSDGKISAGTNINTSNTYEFSVQGNDNNGAIYGHGRNHYLSNRSNAYSSLTLKKSNADSDGIDYLQLRDSSNNLKGHITGAGNWKPIAGGGIDFSAAGNNSGMSSELLDDYEEGSFTLTASPSSGTMTFNSSYNQGTYTKIGNVVHIQAYLSISGNSGSGTLELNSLPFTVKDSTDASGHVRAFSIVYLNNNSPVDGSGYYLAQVYANEGNTWIRIYQVNSLGRRSGDIANKFGGGGDIFLQFTYFAS